MDKDLGFQMKDKMLYILSDLLGWYKNSESQEKEEIVNILSDLVDDIPYLNENEAENTMKNIMSDLNNGKQSVIRENILFDRIIRSLFKLSNGCILGVINKFFDENYEKEIEIDSIKKIFKRTYRYFTDTEIDILLKINKDYYHFKIQTSNNPEMRRSLVNYAMSASKMNEFKPNAYKMPTQAAMFLEEHSDIEDQKIILVLPNGVEEDYFVRTIRFWEYSVESLINEKMYCLLPLTIFKYKQELQSIANSNNQDEKVLEDLKGKGAELREIAQEVEIKIRQLKAENVILEDDMSVMLSVLTDLKNHLLEKFVPDLY
ncbi:MAG: hypothetical protein ATN31_04975 [Candidatus Epulonipiscioides saccharophilum]|nr:MAG: hypothetical protein ATN31_04975 [Epulopiscium sp. AS2M-Bin001]